MAKLVMERKAADNKYLHRDFHVTGEQGIRYIGESMGDNAVVEYLTEFTYNYYKPLICDMKNRGLVAMKEHLEKIYVAEEASDALSCAFSEDKLDVTISYCPAIRFMRSIDYTPCKWYVETTRTVYQQLATASGYGFRLDFYDEETGAAKYSFFKWSL